jgi:hypothetical protein
MLWPREKFLWMRPWSLTLIFMSINPAGCPISINLKSFPEGFGKQSLRHIYSVLKNIVFWARSEFIGSAVEVSIKNYKFQAPNYKQNTNSNPPNNWRTSIQ